MKIFRVLKNGNLNAVFVRNVSTLQKYIKGKKGKRYYSEQHIIDDGLNLIEDLLLDLRFIVFFLLKDYKSSFENLNIQIDSFSIPDDLKAEETLKDFKNFFGHIFGSHLDGILSTTIGHFSNVEIDRLDEALMTLKTGAHFSSVVMSVSAVEARLHNIVRREKPRLYKHEGLENVPLGSLFEKIYSDKKFLPIKKKIPIKYFHLIHLCNQYRIFSAHPKDEQMNYHDSLLVFGLTLSFLLECK